MGFNYEFNGNEVQIRGFNCEEDLNGSVDLSVLRRVKNLTKKEDEGDISDAEEQELDVLREYITLNEDDEDEDEEDD